MRYEVSSKTLYNQLLYFRSLWSLDDKSGGKVAAAATASVAASGANPGSKEGEKEKEQEKEKEAEGENPAEKLRAVKEWNRERFETCWGVVEAYLKRCGRVWVQMDELFRFALGK